MELRMAGHGVWHFIFLFILLEVVVKTKMTIHGNGHAFMQANNEVRYFVDGIGVSSVHEEFTSSSGVRVPALDENSMFNSKLHLKFDPPILDFKERHLGIPHHEKVTLFNVNNNKTIHMSSISGSTVHFHSSFFEDKVIPPLGNTSFNVVFLGREEGEIESSLFIHTSEGSIKYQVKGASVSSPYRLRPLVGVRVPLNSTYSPLIHMHNPHSTPMQIVEVYSSGGDFHLELPSGELEGPKHLWEIPPFLTKPVIRIRFVAKAEKNHTAYVRIKVNKSEEVLVVPIEVEVASHAGLYSAEDVLDFGIGGSDERPSQVALLLYNSWKKIIKIQNIIATPVSKAVKIDFQPVKVPPDSKKPTQVAVITFDWKASFETKHFSGKLVIKSKQSQHKLVIPYMAQVLEGGLEFNSSVTQYCSELGQNMGVRDFIVTNKFKKSVALVNVSLPKEVQPHFKIHRFAATILQPGKSVVLFQLAVKKETIESDLKLESNLFIYTNISTVSISLLCYNGRVVRVNLMGFNESELNFGTVGSSSEKEAYFALINYNPVAVLMKSWGTTMTGTVVDLVGVEQGNLTSLMERYTFTNMDTLSVLMPGHYAVFRVLVQTSKKERAITGEVFVKTQFEKVVIPTKLTVAQGMLETIPQTFVLDNCFPGKLCVQELRVKSTFAQQMNVTNMTSIPPDLQVSYSSSFNKAHILPLSTSTIGVLRFNPTIACRNQCYLGISTNSTAGNQWLHTLGLPIHAQDTDLTLLNTRHNRYVALTDGARSAWHNVTVRMDTTQVRNHVFKVRVRLTWPTLLSSSQNTNSSTISFPLTQIGNTTYREITVHNPSSKPVVIQLALDSIYLQGNDLMRNLPGRFRPDCKECSNSVAGEFTWSEGAEASMALQNQLGVPVHKQSYAALLQPGETVHTRLHFKPMRSGRVSALIYVRNNLTILEVVQVEGQAAHAQFKFGNRKPGSGTPLLFELAEKHLKDCEREKHRKYPLPNLTVKRSFTARNTGDLPVHITAFSINGLPCEGYGFRILNCGPFHLLPNGTRKIDIAFTPDFTLARIQRTLIIETSLGIPVNYTLVTTLPPYFLQSCSTVLGRPSWEPLLYYSAVSFMAFLLFCVLAAAFLESDRILKCALLAMARDRAARASLESKQNSPSDTTKQEVPGDWNLNTSVHVVDKVIKNTQNSSSTCVGVNNKSNSWTVPEEKPVLNETDGKDRANFCEPEVVYSNSSTPLLTIKNKKKLGKRNSSNSDVSESSHGIPILKKTWGSMFSRASQGKFKQQLDTEHKPSVPANTVDVGLCSKKSKDTKRVTRALKKNKIEPEPVNCSEEETSSTTTESSNNEEIEKDRETVETDSIDRSYKSTPNKVKDNTNLYYRDNYEGDCDDDDDYEREAHKKKDFTGRWKSTHKSSVVKHSHENSATTNRVSNVEVPRPPSLELPYKLKSSKNTNRERKDRNVLKRRAAEKVANTKGSVLVTETNNTANTNVRTSPSLRTNNCWGEQRATFSDVVARNDSPLYSSIVAPRKRAPQQQQQQQQNSQIKTPSFADNCACNSSSSSSSSSSSCSGAGNNAKKVTEFPAPTNTSTLGPIGSKKSTSTSSVWEGYGESQLQPETNSSSLFLSPFSGVAHSLQVDESLESSPFAGKTVWEQQNLVTGRTQMKKQQDEYQHHHHQHHQQQQHQNTFQELWTHSLWDPLYTPAVESNSLYNREESEAAPVSVWGSFVNSVWSSSPWTAAPGPIVPPTTRRNDDPPPPAPIAADIDHGLGFDPFRSLNNIWSPRSTDSWSPPRHD